jgi:hypothetical protein
VHLHVPIVQLDITAQQGPNKGTRKQVAALDDVAALLRTVRMEMLTIQSLLVLVIMVLCPPSLVMC